MATIVEKLQQAALDKDTPVNDLLRRVKFVAAKLDLGSVEQWVEQELNGYESTPPDYRRFASARAISLVLSAESLQFYTTSLGRRCFRGPLAAFLGFAEPKRLLPAGA